MNYFNIIIPFVGGLGMFIYGMQIMSHGLENAAGNRMKSLLSTLTKNRFAGVLLGATIAAAIQSSSATTVMVVGFVNAGIMNLSQAVGVIMGANIGTTVTGWLVASSEWAAFLKPTVLAPIAIMIGVLMMLLGKRRTSKDVSGIIVGFGLLFVGIENMSVAMEQLKEVKGFTELFITLGKNPLLGILAGATVTAVIQSSSASVGILQSLATAGLVPFNSALYIIMGQNIGTCVTTMISGMGAKKNAKAAALMHLVFNILGTVLFSVASILFFRIVNPVWATSAVSQTQISGIHTVFNIATTVLLFPAAGWITNVAKKIGKITDEDEGKFLSLDDRMLETPAFAIQATTAEVVRMGQLVKDTLDIAKRVMFTQSEDEIHAIKENENKIDKMCAGITDYTIQITRLQISEKEHEYLARLLQIISDIERVGDYCENISEYAELMIDKKIQFSDMGREELQEMLTVCAGSYNQAFEAFAENDKEKAGTALGLEEQADEMEDRLRAKHMKRLANQECNTEAGIVFLDALVGLERISDHARNIAEEVLEHIG